MSETLKIFGVVGASGSGKTSLLQRLIPELAARGIHVGVIKHSSHGFLADRPGKDSYRLYESGAGAVALISGEQLATFIRRKEGENERGALQQALASLPADLDMVLVEGCSWEPIPRIILKPPHEEAASRFTEAGPVLAMVDAPEAAGGGKPGR